MRTITAVSLIGFVILSGCVTVATQMNIVGQSGTSDFLMGDITPIDNDFRKIDMNVSNFSNSCSGQSLSGKRTLGMVRDTFEHDFPIECSNGLTGVVRLRIVVGQGDWRGSGIGRMSDGSDVRISVGEANGGIVW